jgi:hypothetical protein
VSNTYLVPTFDLRSLECTTVAVSAPNECAAVWAVLRNSAQLRYTGGAVERIEIDPERSVAWDSWAERYRPARLRDKA